MYNSSASTKYHYLKKDHFPTNDHVKTTHSYPDFKIKLQLPQRVLNLIRESKINVTDAS